MYNCYHKPGAALFLCTLDQKQIKFQLVLRGCTLFFSPPNLEETVLSMQLYAVTECHAFLLEQLHYL